MSIALKKATGKPIMPNRYRPSRQEGQYIRYRLRLVGENFVNIARRLHLHQTNIDKVVYGLRRSATIEAEIARILGKESWNDVVMEARREIQNKTLNVIPATVSETDDHEDFDRRFKERFESLGEAKQKKLFKKLRRVM